MNYQPGQYAPWPRLIVGCVAVDLIDGDRALTLVSETLAASSGAPPMVVASANLDHIHHFADDASWFGRTALSAPSQPNALRWLTLLDGFPLVRRANALSGRPWPKLSGSDLLRPMLELAVDRLVRVGFLGGSESTHMRLRPLLAAQYPGLLVAGCWAPGRSILTSGDSSRMIATEIANSQVDMLIVALSKPLQENWVAAFGAETGAKVILCFGAAVDFLTGEVRRAPRLVAVFGGEWAWRLANQPRRLGRRYLVEGPPALLRLMRTATLDLPTPEL